MEGVKYSQNGEHLSKNETAHSIRGRCVGELVVKREIEGRERRREWRGGKDRKEIG